MGFLDNITDQLTGVLNQASGSGEHGGMLEVIGSIINNPQTGGIQGLIGTFQEKGMGGVIASWISTGQNLPITAEQLQAVLGNEQVQVIAQKLGISTDDVATNLTTMLPQVIDKLTPTGEVPDGGALGKALELLQGLGK